MCAIPISLSQAEFHSDFVQELPGSADLENHPRLTPEVCYTRVAPTPVSEPKLLAWSESLGTALGIARPSDIDVQILGGSLVTPSMTPFAARYGGHQFGNWAGQLGDGRAISLGSLIAQDGTSQELQLKGAGPTPYSRFADGRAVLRSSLREFVCSEAMHHLRIPTTRALALVATGDSVVRDMFYSGNPISEPGAITTRVAPSFIRFGNFEILADAGEYENLERLAQYTIRNYFPQYLSQKEFDYAAWFAEVSRRTASLIASWMSVGFVHGVMNTDNMSILGLSIDYGPYGWLEPFDVYWTPNTTDFAKRRYAYGEQPSIGLWNIEMLGRALLPLLGSESSIEDGVKTYREEFLRSFHNAMLQKLGLSDLDAIADKKLVNDLIQLLVKHQFDMTNFFRALPTVKRLIGGDSDELAQGLSKLRSISYQKSDPGYDELLFWFSRYQLRSTLEQLIDEERTVLMQKSNPKYVFRNYLAQNAIDRAEQGDVSYLNRLMDVLSAPYDEHSAEEEFAANRPEWAESKAGCATLSCSS